MSQPSLDRPATYQIRLPGQIDFSQVEWTAEFQVSCEEDPPVTILTVVLDQAALHGLLRQIYSLGIPVISVFHLKDR
jgi:hypothetical protein